ncbi:MAG: aminoglycoside phosphotransferase family protein [Anaerolineae bacterium]|nr:aminoglycoside phosphotransferase family protein [Anaerolineae bacterium]
MRPEPVIDQDALLGALRAAYGIPARRVRYFPTEWSDYCYVVTGADDRRYFLKLHPPQRVASASAASSLDFYLPLIHTLHAQGILPHIPYPIETTEGRLTADFAEYRLILVHFIEGEVLGQARLETAEYQRYIARLVGVLHASTSVLSMPNPLVEQYALAFEPVLKDMLCTLPALPKQATDSQRVLRDFVAPRTEQFLDFVRRARELQAHARALDKPRVICHTDLHGENMMRDTDGELYLLDWENAMLAPPEHDLFFFAGEAGFWEDFLPQYERVAGTAYLDAEVFGFYYYRRALEDMTECMVHILHGNGDDPDMLLDITVECFEGMPSIETTIARLKTRLAPDCKYGRPPA